MEPLAAGGDTVVECEYRNMREYNLACCFPVGFTWESLLTRSNLLLHRDLGGPVVLVSKNVELCIKTEALCIQNEALCIKNEALCIKTEALCI